MNLDDLTFIDVETTGLSPIRDRIIEIGILRMHKSKIVRTYSTLINPQCHLPPEITLITGISSEELNSAPTFRCISEDIEEVLSGSLFVAHNARFDYSFIKSEFARIDKTFTSQILCTAKLSRKLFPKYKNHNLDSLINRFDIPCESRHRALADAQVLTEFFNIVRKQFGMDRVNDAAQYVTKSSSLPKSIDIKTISKLPESPGVYIFYGQGGAPLYVGKSINIKDRVRSHFYEYSVSNTEAKIFQTIESIETIQTSGELGALLLESQTIKRLQPLYNRKLRKAQAFIVLFQTQSKDGYFTIDTQELTNIPTEHIEHILAIYRTKTQMKTALAELAKEHSLCKKLLGLEKTKGRCFGSQIHSCNGACMNQELPAKYNMRFTQAFFRTKIKQWPFSGPIAIREGSTSHIIHKWCYIGEVQNVEMSDTQNFTQGVFDYDLYKILVSQLLRKVHNNQISIIRSGIRSKSLYSTG